MKKQTSPLVTIIIATFNSQKTLPLVLQSIRNQEFLQENLEILLVDGGSTDETQKIGERFSCTMINNPRTEPVYAKYLGFLNAKGKYVMYLDHDEVLESKKSLANKIHIFTQNQQVKAVIGSGYKNPQGYPFINEYINEFGDPFSFFIYRLSKNAAFFIDDMKKKFPIVAENNQSVLFDFSHVTELPIIELCAGGSMFDLDYVKKQYVEISEKPKLIPHIFYLLIKDKPIIAITKQDALIHYSADTTAKYLIKNNIFHTKEMGEAGFTGRRKYQSGWSKMKKYFFLPYAYSLVFLCADALYLVVTRKNIKYFMHVWLTVYTANVIVYLSAKKLLGENPILKSYDETKEIK
jgi:glycosyltransferase involved in cell wall biosynthesis